jgi:glutamate/aspartate transport system permease protein
MEFDFGAIERGLPFLWTGFRYTLTLTGFACAGGIVFGTLLALARLSPWGLLRGIAATYVNVMRSVPLILVIFWFFFLSPLILQSITGAERPVPVGAERSALFTFILFEAAFFCEIIRAGIQSIPRAQVQAAFALGLSYAQSMRLVVLPQAFRNMLPVLLTQVIVLFQDTSLVYVISATDFLGAANKLAQRDNTLVEMYAFVAVVYLLLCLALSRTTDILQRKLKAGG